MGYGVQAKFGLFEPLRARSSTDRMKACGALDPGSIPGGRTRAWE